MGGKLFGGRRLKSGDYKALIGELAPVFEKFSAAPIPSWRLKPDHGDLDVLVPLPEGSGVRETGGEIARTMGGVTATHRNGEVFSLLRDGFQIDLIFAAPDRFRIALAYYSWNDLGNLIGRIAHAMGLKYGQYGLLYPVRAGTNFLGEPLLSADPARVIRFLGLDPDRHRRGFDTLEEIFEYVCDGEYFSPDLFPLEHRSHRARTRDCKRPVYRKFLEYLERVSPPANFSWPPGDDRAGREQFRDAFRRRALGEFPDAAREVSRLLERNDRIRRAKLRWNGEIARRLTGLEGRSLGEFMRRFRERCPDGPEEMEEWVLRAPEEEIARIAEDLAKEMVNGGGSGDAVPGPVGAWPS